VSFFSLTRCPICKERANSSLGCCKACSQTLVQPQFGETWVSLGIYDGKLERAVRAFKFHHTTKLANLFAQEMAAVVLTQAWSIDAVCAVPLHWSRYLERGYNQSALVAKKLAQELGLPYQPLLKRVKRTEQQAKLAKAERLSNVSNAFLAKATQGCILLIDDVITSGATTEACVEALQKAGATQVKVAAIARARIQKLKTYRK
jgi:ComF family protein